jgi:hypothetical protein
MFNFFCLKFACGDFLAVNWSVVHYLFDGLFALYSEQRFLFKFLFKFFNELKKSVTKSSIPTHPKDCNQAK